MLTGIVSATLLVTALIASMILAAGGNPKEIIIAMGFFTTIIFGLFIKHFISKWQITIGHAHIEIRENSKSEPKVFDFSNVKKMATIWGGMIIHLHDLQYGTRRVSIQFMYVENGRNAKHELLTNWKQYKEKEPNQGMDLTVADAE